MDCRLAHRSDSLVTYYKKTIITATAAQERTAVFFVVLTALAGIDPKPPHMPLFGFMVAKPYIFFPL